MENSGVSKPKNSWWVRLKYGRTLSQALFLALTIWVGYRMIAGVKGATIERYCPFGGIETLIPWINKTGTLCSLSTVNLSVLFGLLLVTVLFKRAFCSHICPLGTVLELAGIFGRKTVMGSKRIPEKVDRVLKWVKYPLMILIVVLTVKAGDLVFRDFDPYYVLFTAGQGHGIGTFGMWVTLAVVALGVVLPLFFCKFLCPMGACLAPFGRFGLVKIFRNKEKCTGCGSCDKACEWGVKVSTASVISSAECTNCLECMRKCPVPESLELRIGRVQS